MNTKWHPSFNQWPSASDRRALNHVQPTSHVPPAAASVNQGVAIFSGGAHLAGNDSLRQHAESKTRSGVAPRPGCPFNPSQSSRAKNLHRRGGPGHGSEKRINLSKVDRTYEAPRTVLVHQKLLLDLGL